MPADISFEGRLTGDPELRFTPAGVAVANFTVAINKRIKDASGEWKDGEPTFLRCNAWREMGENVAESLGRGDLILVRGKLEQRNYETKEGEKRHAYEVAVEYVGASLKWKNKTTGKPKAAAPSSDDIPF